MKTLESNNLGSSVEKSTFSYVEHRLYSLLKMMAYYCRQRNPLH